MTNFVILNATVRIMQEVDKLQSTSYFVHIEAVDRVFVSFFFPNGALVTIAPFLTYSVGYIFQFRTIICCKSGYNPP